MPDTCSRPKTNYNVYVTNLAGQAVKPGFAVNDGYTQIDATLPAGDYHVKVINFGNS